MHCRLCLLHALLIPTSLHSRSLGPPKLSRTRLLASGTRTVTLCFAVQYPPEYPDVLPELELEAETGELRDDEREQLLAELKTVGEESLGMAMVFTLVVRSGLSCTPTPRRRCLSAD